MGLTPIVMGCSTFPPSPWLPSTISYHSSVGFSPAVAVCFKMQQYCMLNVLLYNLAWGSLWSGRVHIIILRWERACTSHLLKITHSSMSLQVVSKSLLLICVRVDCTTNLSTGGSRITGFRWQDDGLHTEHYGGSHWYLLHIVFMSKSICVIFHTSSHKISI